MIMLVGFAIAACTVPLAGGHLSRLSRLQLRAAWLVLGALALQVAIISLVPAAAPPAAMAVAHLGSYAMAVAFLILNRHVPGLVLTGVGGLLNLAAIGANDGVMPAAPDALAAAGRAGPGHFVNSAAVPDARLAWLGDVFAIPAPLPLANVFSLGDVVLIVGAAVMLHRLCHSRLAASATTS
ncbi:MAG: DUF5317 domain-containing protein [Actinomycetota bacterium]|jgi:hypothetical protein|nr:DUF5317 domain-containing protein [Actinomycetota bacterium]